MINKYLSNIGLKSKIAAENLIKVDVKKRNKILETYNKELLKNKNKIIKENIKDIKACKRKDLIDRLILNEKKIEDIRDSINQISKFKDPVGRVIEKWKRPNKLIIKKITVPIGVIGIIYESRPNVTCDVSSLCLKSGNVAILRGGSESFYSNKILANLFRNSLSKNNVDKNCIQFIEKKIEKLLIIFYQKCRTILMLLFLEEEKISLKKLKIYQE